MKKVVAIVLSLILVLAVWATASAAMNIPITADDTLIANGNYTLPDFSVPVIKEIKQSGDKVSVTLADNGKGYEKGIFEILFRSDINNNGHWVSTELQGNVLTATVPEDYPKLSIIDFFNYITDDATLYVTYRADGTLNQYEVSAEVYDETSKTNNEHRWNYTGDGALVREFIQGQYEAYYYAGTGALKEYSYFPEAYDGNMTVTCSPDGTVTYIEYWAEDGYYWWNAWEGWTGNDSDGNSVEVDASKMPSIESLAGPALVAKATVNKEDVEIPLNATSASTQLPFEAKDLPAIFSTKVENGKLTITTSVNLDDFNYYKTDKSLATSIGYVYELDGEEHYGWSDDEGSYDPETKTFSVDLPEGAVLVSEPRIVINYQVDNLYYYYSIDEDGVYISASDDLIPNYSQGYQYGTDGKLESVSTYLAEDDYSLYVYFDEDGKLDSYEYSLDSPDNVYSSVTYLADGTLDYVWYYNMEAGQAYFWDEANGWHTRKWDEATESIVAIPAEAPEGAVDPETLKPLVIVSKKPQHVWFPKNTLGLAAVSMKDLGISSDWHNVAPVDLTKDGTTVFTLVGADAWILGQAYVTVADGNVTVDYAILDGHGYMKEEKLNWFLSKADLTEENLKAESNYAFGEPVSIADQLGGAETAILFIDSKITFRQPYFDAFNYSTRYYRNRENWKEYREALIEMIGE